MEISALHGVAFVCSGTFSLSHLLMSFLDETPFALAISVSLSAKSSSNRAPSKYTNPSVVWQSTGRQKTATIDWLQFPHSDGGMGGKTSA
jgi:hypothetical protein